MSVNKTGKIERHVAWGFSALAVLGAAVLIFALGNLDGRQAERRNNYPRAHAEPTKRQAQKSCVGMNATSQFECVYEAVEASEDTARTEQDLTAQQQAAWGTIAGAGIAFMALLATIVGLFYVRGTLLATLEAVKDTGDATKAMVKSNDLVEAAQRPWIRFEVEVTKVEIEADRLTLGVAIHAINIGKSVAQNASVWGALCRHQTLNDNTIDGVRKKIEGSSAFKTHIAPGDRETHWCEGDYDISALHTIGEGEEERALFLVFAAARYYSAGASDMKITERAFSLTEGTKRDPFIPVGFRLPISELLSPENVTILSAGRTRVT